ncbi:hypothetical protein RH915_08305 [Serpentinicella sp. ANB-PHB4]|uniref:tetratricopeptide repeat protein n=1 Tax=Serpentinicella sp. ANB-PHB4 TaxID=3074076 RepID=UPI00286572AE|nr:hypothetical protein [Serpentinicella sp. ANB-PHB4]MDR5659492.1 hypothetical protein [Serpentinicella sp. ANB-PHB4]
MTCKQCNQLLKEDDKFCKKCGTKVTREVDNNENAIGENNITKASVNRDDNNTKIFKTNNKKKVAIISSITAVVIVTAMFFSIRYYRNDKYYAGLIEEASTFMTNAQYQEAIDLYKNYLDYKEDPEVVEKLSQAKELEAERVASEQYTFNITEANQLVESGQYIDAIRLYEQALDYKYDDSINNKIIEAQMLQEISETYNIIIRYMQKGNFEEAISLINQIVTITKGNDISNNFKNVLDENFINQSLELVDNYLEVEDYSGVLNVLEVILTVDPYESRAVDLISELDLMSLELGEQMSLDQEAQREINIFLSNFTEVFFPDYIETPLTENLINFAVRHQHINNSNAIKSSSESDGSLHKDRVAWSVDRFFGLNVSHQRTDQYDFDGTYYKVLFANGEPLPMAVVQEMYDNGDNTYTVYFNEVFSHDLLDYRVTPADLEKALEQNPERIWMGDAKKAVVTRHYFNGENAYKLLAYTTL